MGCLDVSMDGKLCDSEGHCLSGYVCDPVTNQCIRPSDAGDLSDGDGGLPDGSDADGSDGDGGDLSDGGADLSVEGPMLSDPFGDGTTFAYLFAYRGQIYLGPSADGRGALRMWPDGSSPEEISFSIAGDQVASGTTSANNSDAPYSSIGYPDCSPNSPQCGPDNENGRGLFSSGTVHGEPCLLMGGSKTNGHLDYIYFTRDSDTALDWQYVDLSENTGPATKSFSQLHIFGDRAYLGFPDSGGKRPYLLNLMDWPGPGMAGLDPAQNGNGNAACDPAIHGSCFLAAHLMPHIGNDGDPPNHHSPLGIDFIGDFGDRLYLGNNGGLIRSTTAVPLDYASHPEHWVPILPSAAAYGNYSAHATALEFEIRPGDRAWSGLVEYRGRVYLARNVETADGGRAAQLWRCDPSIQAGPPPASASACDPDDWSLIAANSQPPTDLSQFDRPENTAISLLAVNGNWLYLGFDNATDGISLYRSKAPDPLSLADFQGDQACSAADIGCQGLGGPGLGDPSNNQQILAHLSLDFEGRSWLFFLAGSPTGPLRVYRHGDPTSP